MGNETMSKLFVNGRIYQDAVHRVENLLVKGDRVAAFNVNPSEHKDAEEIDLKGNALYPGFCDSHVHLVEAGVAFSGADLSGKNTPAEIIKGVKQAIGNHPEDEPFFGAAFSLKNYDEDWTVKNLQDLDSATGDRIVLLVDDLGHNLIVNSAAMKQAGITADTEVPAGGRIVTNCDNQPTGMLREEAMTLAGYPLLPLFTDDMIQNDVLGFMNTWAAMGYTGIVDLMGAPIGPIQHAEMCRKMERQGVLPLRVNYNHTFFGLEDLEDGLKEMGNDTDLVRFVGNKLFVDGAYAGGQAWTTWENEHGDHGLHTVSGDDSMGKNQNIYRIVERLEELGLNCHYHVQGDLALDLILCALEAAAAKTDGLRCVHTLIHLAFPRPDQIQRIVRFNGKVVTTVEPAFWVAEEGLDRYYGPKNESSYPVKQLIEAGIPTGISTDFFVSPEELSAPTKIMNIAMLGNGSGRNPLTMQDVICGLTQGSAATTGKGDVGTLFPGMKADMVRFERDLYTLDPADFTENNPTVLETWISGQRVIKNGKS